MKLTLDYWLAWLQKYQSKILISWILDKKKKELMQGNLLNHKKPNLLSLLNVEVNLSQLNLLENMYQEKIKILYLKALTQKLNLWVSSIKANQVKSKGNLKVHEFLQINQ